MSTVLDPITRLSRDLKKAAATISPDEARFLVDYYYMMQEDRIRAGHQVRTLEEGAEPHEVLTWLGDNVSVIEQSIKRALDAYTDQQPVSVWAKSIVGIGPIIAAGLAAHINLEPWRCAVAKENPAKKPCRPAEPHGPACRLERCATVGHIWRFAGLDPTVTWEKGQRRPWNATLKTLCWKIGESFVKFSGHEHDFYGKLYRQRKKYEEARNESGQLAEAAARMLQRFNFRHGTDARAAYEAGRLPPGHVHARAKRWTVKLFLSHYHSVAHRAQFGEAAPKPYILTRENHVHEIGAPELLEITVPNWPF